MSENHAAGPPDPEASRFTALWEQYSPRVMGYALRHVDPDSAQEVVSETFLVAWRRLREVPGEPLPWLLVVARNTISNHRRSGYRRAVLQGELERLQRVAEPAPAAEVPAVEREAVLAALAALTQAEREALLLVAWDGLTAAQAARVAGCSTSAFSVRLFRARRRLQAADATTTHPVRPTPWESPA
ncbi:RNA polymerase sigma factor [Blastococcus xanthinilyticus]|uniref:RNA polymerase sigma-70 factor (ECF subfamily) n=1 Tax=Blastococcus xanthinilyticus TaxID=1564164 RepID=A0A5S5CLH6_9ACTN|nr:RNA polymerase sigma factor [Blastococcus xanthinilyticus]TYP81255.1 RNA polymerase sigma-70 factor (ECF subfamily) [Blastococcus xanthinilyticus]